MTLKNYQWGKVTPAFQVIRIFMFCHTQQIIWKKTCMSILCERCFV